MLQIHQGLQHMLSVGGEQGGRRGMIDHGDHGPLCHLPHGVRGLSQRRVIALEILVDDFDQPVAEAFDPDGVKVLGVVGVVSARCVSHCSIVQSATF